MCLLAGRGNGRAELDGCRRSRPGSSWPAKHAGEAAMKSVQVIICALVLTTSTAAPVRAENVVRWVSAAVISSWEPAKDDTPTQAGLDQVYEGLTLTDSDLTLRPGLATAWTLTRPDTWRFELRRGVRFHDDSLLTAADVVFSLNRVGAEGSQLADLTPSIVTVTPTAEDTVEVTTKGPDLLLP